MDGTLLESMRYWRMAALNYIICNDLPINDEILSGLFKRGAGNTIKMAYELAGREDYEDDAAEISDKILEYVVAHYRGNIKPKPNVRAYLEKLKKEGVRCCVATATDKEYAVEVLKKHDMDRFFEFVFDVSDAGCSKAKKEFFDKLMDVLGSSKEDCVMFEDALYSIRTAAEYGIRVVGVEDFCAANDAEEIKRLTVKYISDYSELI